MAMLTLKFAVWVAHWRVTCGTPSEGAGIGMAIEEQMAWLANAVYKLRTPVAGWRLEHFVQLRSAFSGETDNFALYTFSAERMCALAVAGTDHAMDMQDNFDGRVTYACGFDGIHQGYWGEVSDLLNSCEFHQDFLPTLQSETCSGGVHIVGHSLGGGVASVLAACANNPARPYGFEVECLWTFGAPGVSKTPLVNSLSSSGCFKGGRFWNQDSLSMDPIPGLSRGLNFVHPRLKATRLDEKASEFHATSYTCDTIHAHQLPNPTDALPQPLLHVMSAYTQRTNTLFTPASFTSPTMPPWAHVNVTTPAPTCLANFSYERGLMILSDYGFQDWDPSPGKYLVDFCTFVLCIVLFSYTLHTKLVAKPKKAQWRCALDGAGYKYGEPVEVAPRFRGIGWPERGVHLLEDGQTIFVELVTEEMEGVFFSRSATAPGKARGRSQSSKVAPACQLSACQDQASPCDEAGASSAQPEARDGEKIQEAADSMALSACSRDKAKLERRWCRAHHSRPPEYTVTTQLLLLTACLGLSRFFAAIAMCMLASYKNSGLVMGRRWSSEHSGWMGPWTACMVLAPMTASSAMGVLFTHTKLPDRWVVMSHNVGILTGGAEAALLVLSNLASTGDLTRIFSLVASGIASAGLAIACIDGFMKGESRMTTFGRAFLLIGLACLLVGYGSGSAMVLRVCFFLCALACFVAAEYWVLDPIGRQYASVLARWITRRASNLL